MSDSTSPLDQLATSAADNVSPANDLFNAASPAAVFAYRRSTSSGLTWGYYGGRAMLAGVMVAISSGTLALTASQTNFVEVNPATGVVSSNTSGFTAGRVPLYKVVCGVSAVTSWEDWRLAQPALDPRTTRSMASDANVTLTAAEAAGQIVEVTSAVSLTAQRNVVLPLVPRFWIVANLTTGAQSLQFIGATGTGVVVGNGKRRLLYCDGTNIVAAGPDA